jgi:hypothetical protein
MMPARHESYSRKFCSAETLSSQHSESLLPALPHRKATIEDSHSIEFVHSRSLIEGDRRSQEHVVGYQ